MRESGEEPGPGGAARYWAFVSYSHADSRFAGWLHRQLERYRLPDGPPATARRVFIDRAELAAGSDLSVEVRSALARSAALVVVASPAARASRWVAREIEEFRQLHPDAPVLVALAEGTPEQAFPTLLLGTPGAPIEPLAADFRRIGDGRTLALQKLVAGLAGVPLDRLIQRDSQRRLRRVTAITAASLALSLGTGGLAIAAIRARAEAEAQRNESEAMVEFMLTDLRQRLRAVGRLDVMGAVNDRAMQHYDTMQDLSSLPDEVLERRARLLSAMGEDAFNDKQRMGRAEAIFRQSWRTTRDLLRRRPADPQRLFDHAQNEYWLGAVPAFRGDKAAAAPHFKAYRALVARLQVAEPGATRTRRELGYAESNLCQLALMPPAEPREAAEHCKQAAEAKGQLASANPADVQSQIDYSNGLGWLADARRALGDTAGATAIRRRQVALMEGLARRFPDDFRVLHFLMMARVGLALHARHIGDDATAAAMKIAAAAILERLHAHDPNNRDWAMWRGRIPRI